MSQVVKTLMTKVHSIVTPTTVMRNYIQKMYHSILAYYIGITKMALDGMAIDKTLTLELNSQKVKILKICLFILGSGPRQSIYLIPLHV